MSMYGNRKIQKAKPSPFARPGIALADHAAKREWMDLKAYQVEVGDTIPDLGVVANISKHFGTAESCVVRLVSGHGKELAVADDAILKVFHRVG